MKHNENKILLIVILAFMSSVAPLATDMYLPALTKVQESFKTSEFFTQLSLSSFFAAFALGQLIYGPLSDVYGRKKPLCIGIFIFIISSFACICFDNIYTFIFFRFMQALGGCAGVVIARAIINDKFDFKEGAAVLSLMMVVGSIAPMTAPSIGGAVLDIASWKFIFITLFGLGILLFMMIVFGLKESGKADKTLILTPLGVAKNYILILQDRRYTIFMLTSAITMSAMFAYIAGSSFVFMKFYELSHRNFGFIFGLNAFGMVVASTINAKLTQKFSPYKILQNAFFAMIIGVLFLLVCGYFEVKFWLFELCLLFTIAMKGFIIPNAVVLAMSRFKTKSGSASAVLGATQFALAGLTSFIVGFVGANHPFSLALVMSVCVFGGFFVFLNIHPKFWEKFKRFLPF